MSDDETQKHLDLINNYLQEQNVGSDAPKEAPKQEARPEPVKEEVEVKAEEPAVELSPEDEARKKGWRPDGGELSAQEFLAREPLYKELKALRKEMKDRDKAIKSLVEFNKKTEKVGYEKALQELQMAKRDAITESNVEAVEEIDKLILDKQIEMSQVEAPTELPTEVVEFVDRNASWAKGTSAEDIEMQKKAHALDNAIAKANGGYTDARAHLVEVENAMKALYPHRFEQSKEKQPSPVMAESRQATGSAASAKKGKLTWTDLTPEEKRMAHYFKQSGGSVEEYLDKLAKVR